MISVALVSEWPVMAHIFGMVQPARARQIERETRLHPPPLSLSLPLAQTAVMIPLPTFTQEAPHDQTTVR